MDRVYVIRHKVLVERQSVRRVARELGVSRNTVKRYVEGAQPCVRAPVARSSPVKQQLWPHVEQMLAEAPRWTGGKQRLTAARLYAAARRRGPHRRRAHRQRDGRRVEAAATGGVRAARVSPGRPRRGGLLRGPRRRRWPTAEGVDVRHAPDVLGPRLRWLYHASGSGRFLDGHVRAFAHFGVVPQRIAYDNLKPAVARTSSAASVSWPRASSRSRRTISFEPSFCASADRPRQGRRRGARQGHSLAAPRADSVRARPARDLDARSSSGSTRRPKPSAAPTGALSPSVSPTSARACCRCHRCRFARRRSITSSCRAAASSSWPARPTRCGVTGSGCQSKHSSASTRSRSSAPTDASSCIRASRSADAPSTIATTCPSWRRSRRRCVRSPTS